MFAKARRSFRLGPRITQSRFSVSDICLNIIRGARDMYDPFYYREQAERARRLATGSTDPEAQEILKRMAQDYEDIATDLESGAIEIRHPDLMPQSRRLQT